jgi:RNA polymerase sigma factor for flagellar operon FliA
MTETEAWRRWHAQQDAAARDWLVEHHYPVVVQAMRAFKNVRAQDREDLVAAGSLGLVKAVDEWDPQRKPWLPYVRFKVKAAMVDQMREMSWVRKSFRSEVQQLEEAAAALEVEKGGCPPTDEELAQRMGLDLDGLAALQSKLRRTDWHVASLDAPASEDGGSRMEALPDPTNASAEVEADRRERQAALRSILARLPDRLRLVLELRFFHGLPQKEIARRIGGVHESRVSQLMDDALALARQLASERPLSLEDEVPCA